METSTSLSAPLIGARTALSGDGAPSLNGVAGGAGGRGGAQQRAALELAYLSLASMAGVWVRITCGVTFSTTLAMMDASGPFFKDLPANMVGCFIIGLLADGATALRRRSGAGTGADDASLGCAVAALPLDSAQQRNAPLWRGLRLGLCGATTSFSSSLQQIGMMLYEGRVAAAAFGVVVGLQAAVMCCAAGEAVAAALHAAANRQLRAAERRALGEGEFEEEEEGGGGGGYHAAPGNDDDDDDDVEAGAVERRSSRECALRQLRKARGERRSASDARTLRLTHATACALLLALLVHALLAYRSGASTWVFPYSASAATNRGRWLAILLCPLGSVARAALARLNDRGRLGELPDWFPARHLRRKHGGLCAERAGGLFDPYLHDNEIS